MYAPTVIGKQHNWVLIGMRDAVDDGVRYYWADPEWVEDSCPQDMVAFPAAE